MMSLSRVVFLLALLVLAAHGAIISVTTFNDVVASDGECSLREAIMTANGNAQEGCDPGDSGLDTVLLPAGEFLLTRAGNDDTALNGDLDILEDIIVTTENDAIVNALGQFEVFHVISGTARFENLVIKNGHTTNSDRAGGITNDGGDPLYLENVVMENNAGVIGVAKRSVEGFTGDSGAGAVLSNGVVSITNCVFSRNSITLAADTADAQMAGAVMSSTSIIISASSFTDNRGQATAFETDDLNGSEDFPSIAGAVGLFNSGSGIGVVIAEDTHFEDNTGMLGGAILAEVAGGSGTTPGRPSVQTRNCAFVDNEATGDGGAIFASGAVFMEGSGVESIENNRAGRRGGVVFTQDSTHISNFADITRNQAGTGGVVYAVHNVRIDEIAGDISSNTVSTGEIDPLNTSFDYGFASGGVALAVDGHIRISDIGGSIRENTAARGGVAYALDGFVTIEDVVGSISRNQALYGGVVYASEAADIINVGGRIVNNAAYFGGGVALVNDGTARIANTGAIENNSVSRSVTYYGSNGVGGVAAATHVIIDNVAGITRNAAFIGGVAFTTLSCRISNVYGDIALNEATAGGVIGTVGSNGAEISYVTGAIRQNAALGRGGVVWSHPESFITHPQPVQISEVYQGITDNIAGAGDFSGVVANQLDFHGSLFLPGGGVVFSLSGAVIESIVGDISGNASFESSRYSETYGDYLYYRYYSNNAYFYVEYYVNEPQGGGVLFCGRFENSSESYLSPCVLRNIDGSISDNEASRGGVVLSEVSLTLISGVTGSLSNNVAQNSGGIAFANRGVIAVRDIDGSIYGNESGIAVSDTYIDTFFQDYFTSLATNAHGGALFARGDVIVADVDGNISENRANLGSNGGFAFSSEGDVRIVNVGGECARNFAGANGGFAAARYGTVDIAQVGGSLSNNSSGFYGAVAWGFTVDVSNIGGSISQNTGCSFNLGDFDFSLFEYARSGGAFSAVEGIRILNVQGDIAGNECVGYSLVPPNRSVEGGSFSESRHDGGVAHSRSGVIEIANIGGSIRNNDAGSGGVAGVFFNGAISIHDVGGDISFNHADVEGAVATTVFIRDLFFTDIDTDTLIYYNYLASSNIVVSDIGGSISDNVAGLIETQEGGFDKRGEREYIVGGAVFAATGSCRLRGIGGDIARNQGHIGGVMSANIAAEISDVGGSIFANRATAGAVIYSAGESVKIENVAGSISDNHAILTGGIIAATRYEDVTVTVNNIGGSLSGNVGCEIQGSYLDTSMMSFRGEFGSPAFGQLGGGAIFMGEMTREVFDIGDGGLMMGGRSTARPRGFQGEASVIISNIGGSITENAVMTDWCSGGFVFGYGAVSLSNIGGSISNNFSAGLAGVAMAAGRLSITNVTGDISHNESTGAGGVAVSIGGNVLIENVGGDVSYNVAEAGTFQPVIDPSSFRGEPPLLFDDTVLCGGVACGPEAVNLNNVQGNVWYNSAAYGGVLGGSVTSITNVSGSIRYNDAYLWGGVIYSEYSVLISNVGEVSDNSSRSGGVAASAFDEIRVFDVRGSISRNSASGGNGGAFIAQYGLLVTNVEGDISDNFCTSDYISTYVDNFGPSAPNPDGFDVEAFLDYDRGRGGFALTVFGRVTISGVTGDICRNSAVAEGGVVYNGSFFDFSIIENVGGEVCENRASEGGVAYSNSVVTIANVGGSIRRNESFLEGGYGGVVRAMGVIIQSVGGSITRNAAGNGSVIAVPDTYEFIYEQTGSGYTYRELRSYLGTGAVNIIDVAGDISYNTAAEFGGVVYSVAAHTVASPYGSSFDGYNEDNYGTPIVLAGIGGSIKYNASSDDGGVVYARYSSVILRDIYGDITRNTSGESGGVVYTTGASEIRIEGAGEISYNAAAEDGGAFSMETTNEINYTNLWITGVGDIKYNFAEEGGAIYMDDDGTVNISFAGDLSHNTAYDNGGFIYAEESIVNLFEVGAISHNHAEFDGGAITGYMIFAANTGAISFNTAESGGAFYSEYGGHVSRVNGPIEHNQAFEGPGGFFYQHNSSTTGVAGDVILEDVAGPIQYNTAENEGGAVYCESGDLIVQRVQGGILYNTALEDGGFAYVDGALHVIDIFGNIQGNRSLDGSGGFAGSEGNSDDALILIRNIHGDIRSNTCTETGGAVYSDSNSIAFEGIDGEITGNIAYEGGGVCYAGDSELFVQNVGAITNNVAVTENGGAFYTIGGIIDTVRGDIAHNSAHESGGFMYGDDGYTVIRNVYGDIRSNRANSDYGGAVYSFTGVSVSGVTGSIVSNRAYQGGAFYSEYSVYIEDIAGSISRNTAYDGGVAYTYDSGTSRSIFVADIAGSINNNLADRYGGAFATYGRVDIARVGGSINDNRSVEEGGVVYCEDCYGTTFHDIAGDIRSNSSLNGRGGVIYVEGSNLVIVELSDIAGSICGNYAAEEGGVVYSDEGEVIIATVGDGSIQENESGVAGGVVNADGFVRIDADDGIIHGNIPDVAVSRNDFTQVLASLNTQGGNPTVTIVQEPGSGVERVPLEQQPILDISGAIEGKPVPISVTLVFPDGDERVLPGPFNVRFGEFQEFQDLSIPVFGENLRLRFAFSIVGCVHDDVITEVTVDSARFNITECEYPHPVVCPSDIVVPNERHECSAFVDVPMPSVERCSVPIITHDITTPLLTSVASATFDVGSTLVTYFAENSAGVSDSCLVRVTVTDVDAPTLLCADDIAITNDPGQCGAIVTIPDPIVTDNCLASDVVLTSDHPDAFFPVGVTSVTYTGVDNGGNSDTCTVTVTVVDSELPTIVCPEDLVVACGSPPTFPAPIGTDNCPGAVTTQTNGPALGGLTPLPAGVTTFSFQVHDEVGQRGSCQWNVRTESTWYIDVDGDGVGALGSTARVQCPAPGPNWVQDKNTDCDDTNPLLGLLVYPDADRDTYGNPTLEVCVEYTFFQLPARRDVGANDNADADEATDNFIARAGDCDDTNPLVNPGILEVCGNGIDDNCDGFIDENCPVVNSTITLPTVPMPAQPLAPVPSNPTPIVIPTPLPRVPPSPPVFDPIVIPEFTASSAALASLSVVALLFSVMLSLSL